MRLPTLGKILQYRFRSSFTSQHFDIKRYDIYIATATHVEYKPYPYDSIDISRKDDSLSRKINQRAQPRVPVLYMRQKIFANIRQNVFQLNANYIKNSLAFCFLPCIQDIINTYTVFALLNIFQNMSIK